MKKVILFLLLDFVVIIVLTISFRNVILRDDSVMTALFIFYILWSIGWVIKDTSELRQLIKSKSHSIS